MAKSLPCESTSNKCRLYRSVRVGPVTACILILCLSFLLIHGISLAWSNVISLNSPRKVTSDSTTLTGFPKYIAQGQYTMYQSLPNITKAIDKIYGTAGNHSPAFDFSMHYGSIGDGFVPGFMPPQNPLSFIYTHSNISICLLYGMGGLSNVSAGLDFEGLAQISACSNGIFSSLQFSSTACLQWRPTIDERFY